MFQTHALPPEDDGPDLPPQQSGAHSRREAAEECSEDGRVDDLTDNESNATAADSVAIRPEDRRHGQRHGSVSTCINATITTKKLHYW